MSRKCRSKSSSTSHDQSRKKGNRQRRTSRRLRSAPGRQKSSGSNRRHNDYMDGRRYFYVAGAGRRLGHPERFRARRSGRRRRGRRRRSRFQRRYGGRRWRRRFGRGSWRLCRINRDYRDHCYPWKGLQHHRWCGWCRRRGRCGRDAIGSSASWRRWLKRWIHCKFKTVSRWRTWLFGDHSSPPILSWREVDVP